jgi:hypothetical protein
LRAVSWLDVHTAAPFLACGIEQPVDRPQRCREIFLLAAAQPDTTKLSSALNRGNRGRS